MPGSNWHVYLDDPDGHQNELFYGMEQVGWDGLTKPYQMYRDKFADEWPVPQRSETQEIEDSISDGIDIFANPRDPDVGPTIYNVGGVLLPRPFRVTQIGPIGLFVRDMPRVLSFYTQMLGFRITERAVVEGHESIFLRASHEHHSLALYPFELKQTLGLPAASTCAVIGFQVASYKQLKEAIIFLQERKVPVFQISSAFNTGIDYAVHFLDPDGHLVRLYHAMECVDWEGNPKPISQRNMKSSIDDWPEVLPDIESSYAQEIFKGPVG